MTTAADQRPTTAGLGPLAVLTAYGGLISLDVAMLGALLPRLQAELGFGDGAAGVLAAAGTLAAVVASLPAGRICDARHRPRLLGVVALVWAAATGLVATAPTFMLLAVARVLLGAVNAFDNPIASSLLTELYPPQRRARVFAVHRFGTFLGTPLGLVGGAALGAAIGWRLAFAVIVPAVLLVGLAGTRTPEPRPPDVRPQERPSLGPQLAALLQDRALRWVLAAAGLLGVPAGAVVFWLPSVWQRDHGLSEQAAGALAGLVVVIGLSVGVLAGGIAGDRGGGRPAHRIAVARIGLAAGVVPFVAGLLVGNRALAVALLALGMSLTLVALPNLSAAIGDLTPAPRHGLAYATSNMLTALGAALGPLLVGGLAAAGLRLSPSLAATGLAIAAAAGVLGAAAAADPVSRDQPAG